MVMRRWPKFNEMILSLLKEGVPVNCIGLQAYLTPGQMLVSDAAHLRTPALCVCTRVHV